MEITNTVGNMQTNTADMVSKSQPVENSQETRDVTHETTTEKNAKDKEEIKEQLAHAVENLNKQMERLDTNIHFGFNDKIDTMYVDVQEKSTGKIIRKFPSEEAMKLTEHFREIIGIIFDSKG